jgi:hypothetical protein
MHTQSWCCDRSSLELSAEFNMLLLLFFNNVECLPCSTCYIYVCNASQNLSIFRSHRDFPSFLREKNFAVQFLSNLQQQQQQQISNLRPSAVVAASAAGEDF